MISIWINGHHQDGIDEGWIARAIQSLRSDGESVCVRVAIKSYGIDLALTAGNCPPSQGGRQPTARELAVFEVWKRCRANGETDVQPGQLIKCLKELERVV